MFDVQIAATVRSVKVSVTEKDGVVLRKCRMVLAREFDETIAAGLGKDAKKILTSLKNGGIEDATLPMSDLAADATLKADGGAKPVKIGSIVGVKAKATAGKDAGGEDPPTIALEFEFAFNDEAWLFLGQNCGATALVTIRRRQLDLVRDAG